MAPPAGFTHLHVHSWFTLLGGTASPEELASRAAADGLRSLALTDRDALYGVWAFSSACQKVGVRPILGMTLDVAAPFSGLREAGAGPGQVVLLATGPEGYRSLSRLSSLVQGHPDRAHRSSRGIDWEALGAHREGLLCLDGGRGGWLAQFLRAGDDQAARDYVSRLGGLFGEDGYLSLEVHGPGDEALAREIEGLGARSGIPCVAVQPVYCLDPHGRPTLRLLAAIDGNRRLDEVPAASLPDGGDPAVDLHWLSPAEVARRFRAFPQALERVGEVAARCQPVLPEGRPIWPALSLPEGQTPEKALAEAAYAGLRVRYADEGRGATEARLEGELGVIVRHGFAPLFLVVADIARFARESSIPVSTRGSVANSLVAYCLGITDVDPIEHDLLFERFLNPARTSPPDIDLDFCSRRRDQVLEYVRRTYGEEHVALVGTMATLRLKGAVREVAKAYGLPEVEIKALTSGLPGRWHPDPRRRADGSLEALLEGVADERAREVLRAAYRLSGQPRHLSVHPGGLVITPGPLSDYVPVQWAPKGFLITQHDHADLEAIGLPKVDLLGIRALTVLADSAELVRANRDAGFRLEDIPPDDGLTGDVLERGDTIGVFQCESEGARRTLRKLRARTVRDLAVANAFFKPGPAMGGQAASFVRRYRGEEPVRYLHPALEPILGSTKGVLIFQEQILRVAREIAGLSWEQADGLRRGMSKFEPEAMAALRGAFVSGCQRPPPEGPGFTAEQAATLWEQVAAFAGYGFNQGHATAYAGVSYRSAYLKAHYPAAFLCARLASAGGFHHPAIYMAEAVRLGIRVRPPHVNHSRRKFTLRLEGADGERPALWMGLGWVRDLRRSSILEIVRQRKRAPFADLRDLLVRVPLQKKEVTHLIQCGALDGLAGSRAELLSVAESLVGRGDARQGMFTFAIEDPGPPETPAQRLAWEQRLLGLPVSVHPMALVEDGLEGTTPLRRLPEAGNRELVIAGVRLPGWTGGEGLFLSDGDGFVVVKLSEPAGTASSALRVWKPVRLRGCWRRDEWGGGWFQAERLEALAVAPT